MDKRKANTKKSTQPKRRWERKYYTRTCEITPLTNHNKTDMITNNKEKIENGNLETIQVPKQ